MNKKSESWRGLRIFVDVCVYVFVSVLAGWGAFYIELNVLQNSFNYALFVALIISSCVTGMFISLHLKGEK